MSEGCERGVRDVREMCEGCEMEGRGIREGGEKSKYLQEGQRPDLHPHHMPGQSRPPSTEQTAK